MMSRSIVVVIFIAMCCCKSNDPQIITAAPGTLVAYFDGVVKKSIKMRVAWPPNSSNFRETMYIQAYFKETDTTRIDCSVATNNTKIPVTTGEYFFKGNDPLVAAPAFFYVPFDGKGAFTSQYFPEPIAGKVVISELDEVNKLVSGTFEVKLVRASEKLTITKGSFNKIQYTP